MSQKQELLMSLVDDFTKAITDLVGCSQSNISVGIHKVPDDFFTENSKTSASSEINQGVVKINRYKVEHIDSGRVTLFGKSKSEEVKLKEEAE